MKHPEDPRCMWHHGGRDAGRMAESELTREKSVAGIECRSERRLREIQVERMWRTGVKRKR